MSSELVPLADDEIAVIPVEGSVDLALAIGKGIGEIDAPVPRSMVDAAVRTGGLLGGATAASSLLLDGSLVRLAPETVQALNQGAVFARDAQGLWLGSLRTPGTPGFSDAVRLVPGAVDPVAAGMILQTMAIQYQLGQIQRELETVNAKLDLLLEGKHYEVLAEITAISERLDELRGKAADGHDLTAQDEIMIRHYEDAALTRRNEADLWLRKLHELLNETSLPLKQHHRRLQELMDRHVAFWVRAYVASQMALANARVLRLVRASTSASESWVGQLHESVREELSAIGGELVSLTSDLDAYLRRSDIARGLEELSILRKRKVDRLRNELWKTQEDLRAGLEDVLPRLPRLDDRALPALPAPLGAQELQLRPVREDIKEGVQTARKTVSQGSKRAAHAVGGKALKGIDRAGQKLRERLAEAPDEQDGS
jgi:hypothetical protein